MSSKPMQTEIIESAASSMASKASYGSAAALTIFGIGMHDIALIIGTILGIGTFCVNWYYRHKESQRGIGR